MYIMTRLQWQAFWVFVINEQLLHCYTLNFHNSIQVFFVYLYLKMCLFVVNVTFGSKISSFFGVFVTRIVELATN